ncbi:hypothetical protein C8R43DRAFT_1135260 [Mycena crocata]|nr:hypothetical protein C8R43DRAFT_1135260 [Mycena crocata]
MQKIALQRVNPDGTRHYLSAAGPIPGTQGVVAPPAPGSSSQAGSHPLLFQSPRVRDEMKDGVRVITDDVDDYLCWTIVGISKFQYTFFDAFGQNNNIPDMPITPFPTLFTAPVYRQTNNTIELTVANFFYADPTTGAHTPLDVYLGNLGPLRHRVYQASPPGPLTNISSFVNRTPSNVMDNTEPAPSTPASPVAPRFNGGPLHAIVIVEMPPMADVIKALEEDAVPTAPNDAPSSSRPAPPSDNAPPNGVLPPTSVAGRSLPLLFIRPTDGVGYHSGRTIACENVFQPLEMGNIAGNPSNGGNVDTGWLAAASAAAAADGGLHGWTLRVM